MTNNHKKEILEQAFIKATMEFSKQERLYDEIDDDAAEHMLVEDRKWRARSIMDELYDELQRLNRGK